MKLRLSSIALTLVINFVVSNVTLAQVVNPDNCLFISMIDGYGDGWNGATFTITDSHGDTWATGTLATGSYGEQDFCIPDGCYHVEVTAGLFPTEVYWSISDVNEGFVEGFGASEVDFSIGTINEGCTDPEATNYLTYPFTDVPLYNCNDGSCCYANAYMLTLEDSYGDGWNGGSISFQNSYGIEGSYTLEAGSISSQEICLPDGCYIAVVVGGEFPSEISWSLTPLYQGGGLNIDDILNPFGTTHTGTNNAPVSGGAPALVSFEAGDAVPGCTSPSANNYEPYAVCNDGSCEYCDANMTLELFDTGNDGWEGHTLTIYEAGIGLVANYTLKEGGYRIIQLCLPPSCNPYYAVVEQGFGGSEVSYSIQRWSDGAVFSGAPGEIIGFHASGVVFGCMDSSALNYNPAANCADCNGCEYPTVGSCPGDLDNNGIVNVSDLLLFSATFGTSCE